MYNVHQILGPVKFIIYITQVILTISVTYTKDDNIFAQISYLATKASSDYINTYNT